MEKLIHDILEVLGNWIGGVIRAGGYPGIIILMAIESACIPLPSELIMPFAGALTVPEIAAQHGKTPLDIHLVSLAGALGCALGSAVAYWVGLKGGRTFVLKYGKFILLREHDVDMADRWFAKHGQMAFFIARLLPVIRTFISLPAGITRVKFMPFLILSFVGSVPWCYFLAYVGVVFAKNLEGIRKYFHGVDIVIGVFLLAGLIYWIWHHFKPQKPHPPTPTEATS